jgi:HKD family nuclease
MEEFHIIRDIPASAKFHSCIISSFAFDYYFFDIQIRRYLHRKGIYNIIVLCDGNMLDQSINAISHRTQHIFKDYTIIPVESKGCFHPKLFAFIGQDQIMLHIGSGNLTNGGMGKNHELFSTFSCNSRDDSQYQIIKSGIDYLVSKIQNTKGFVKQQLTWILDNSNLLSSFDPAIGITSAVLSDNSSCKLLFNDGDAIYQHLTNVISIDQVQTIKIVSPFFDGDGRFISRLLADFSNAQLEIFVQEYIPLELSTFIDNDRVTFYDWSETKRGKALLRGYNTTNVRQLHAKIFIFETEGDSYLLHGSPNATYAAFGLNTSLVNDEAAILFSYSSSDLLPEIGLSPQTVVTKSISSNFKKLPNPESIINHKVTKSKILGIDKYTNKIQAYLSIPGETTTHINFCDIKGELLESVLVPDNNLDITLTFNDHPKLRNTALAYLSTNDVQCSKNAYVNDVHYLQKGNPSKENQRLQKLLSTIMLGNMNEFDIFSHLSLIMKDKDRANTKKYRSTIDSNTTPVSMSYEESKALLESKQSDEESILFSSSKKLLDAINAIIQISKTNKEEQEMDQDEADDKDGGQDRDLDHASSIYSTPKVFRSQKTFDSQQKKVMNLYNGYMDFLANDTYRLSELKADKYISTSELSYFIVLYLQLLHITNKQYQVKEHDNHPHPILISKSSISFQESFTSISLSLIGHFLLYLNSYDFKQYDDDYSKEELDKSKVQLSLLITFGLTLHYKLIPKHSKWIESLLLNANNILPPVSSNQIQLIAERLPDISLEIPNDISEVFNQLMQAAATNNDDYTILPDVGTISVLKYIPNKTQQNAIRITFPGICYLEKTKQFEYPKLYLVKDQKWYLRQSN